MDVLCLWRPGRYNGLREPIRCGRAVGGAIFFLVEIGPTWENAPAVAREWRYTGSKSSEPATIDAKVRCPGCRPRNPGPRSGIGNLGICDLGWLIHRDQEVWL